MPTPHGQSDQHLADAARAGDQEALGELWMSYHPRLAAFIRSRDHRIDAEDAASFVLERTVMALRSGGGPRESVSSYLFRAARNTVADARHRTVDIDDVEEPAETVTSDPHTAVPTQAAISSALTRMRAEEAQLLSAVYLGGQAVGDAAREAGVSPDTLSARLYRARRAFQAIWLQDHVEPQARLESCLPYRAQVGAIVSGHTTGAGAARFWVHVDECDDCSAAIASAQRNARSLAVGFPALGALTALDGVLPAGLLAAGTGAGAGAAGGAGGGAAGAGGSASGSAAAGGSGVGGGATGATGLSGSAGAGTGASVAGTSGVAGGAGAAGTVGAAGAAGTEAAAAGATAASSASAGGFGTATLTTGGAAGSGAVAAGAIAGGASSAAAATFPLGLKIAAALAAVGVIVAATLAITRPWEGADATPPHPETTTSVPQESTAAEPSSEPTTPENTAAESPEPSVGAPASDTPNDPAAPGATADADGSAAAAGDPAGTQATGDGGQAPSGSATPGSATPEPTATPGPTTADPTESVPPTARTTCGWSPDVECLDR